MSYLKTTMQGKDIFIDKRNSRVNIKVGLKTTEYNSGDVRDGHIKLFMSYNTLMQEPYSF